MIDLWREKEKDPDGISESGYPNYVAYPNTDWMKAVYDTGIYQKHNISASGAAGGTKYLISMTYVDNPGVIDNTGAKKFLLRANVSSQVTKWLEIGARIWGTESNRETNNLAFNFCPVRFLEYILITTESTAGWKIRSRVPTAAITCISSIGIPVMTRCIMSMLRSLRI